MNRGTEMKLVGAALAAGVLVVALVMGSTLSARKLSPFGSGAPDPTVERATLLLPGAHAKGDPGAPFTLVEFGDLQCRNSLFARQWIREYSAKYPGKLRLLSYHMQTNAGHVHEELLARATEAAAEQGRYWEMRDAVLDRLDAFTKATGPQASDLVLRLARNLKLDVPRFTASWRGADSGRIYQRDSALARKLDFRYTPGFFFLYPSGPPIRLYNTGIMLEWLQNPTHWK